MQADNVNDKAEVSGATHSRPLSPAQLSIWRSEVLQRHTPRWTQITVIRLSGVVDACRLEQAIKTVVARHPALRTRLERRGGKAVQSFPAEVDFCLSQHWRLTDLDDQEAIIGEFLQGLQHNRFTLYGGILFRADLLLLSNTYSVLALSLHHIAADGISLALLVPQIAAAYRGDTLNDSGVDLAYEHWLDRQLDLPPALDAAAMHYRRELTDANLRSENVYDQPHDNNMHEPPALLEATCTLEATVCDGLRGLARDYGATLFIVLFAAYAATIRSFSDQDDTVIATFVSGRAGERLPIIGSCINTVLVRIRLAGHDTPKALIDAIKEPWRVARRHQAVPLTLLSGLDGAALPLSQFAINFLDMNETSFEVPGLASSITHAQQGFPHNDILLYALREQDKKLRLRLISGSGTARISQARLDAMLDDLTCRLSDWSQVNRPPN